MTAPSAWRAILDTEQVELLRLFTGAVLDLPAIERADEKLATDLLGALPQAVPNGLAEVSLAERLRLFAIRVMEPLMASDYAPHVTLAGSVLVALGARASAPPRPPDGTRPRRSLLPPGSNRRRDDETSDILAVLRKAGRLVWDVDHILDVGNERHPPRPPDL